MHITGAHGIVPFHQMGQGVSGGVEEKLQDRNEPKLQEYFSRKRRA